MGSSESKEEDVIVMPINQGSQSDSYHNLSVHKSTLGATLMIMAIMICSMTCCYLWCKNLLRKPGVRAIRKEIEMAKKDQLADFP